VEVEHFNQKKEECRIAKARMEEDNQQLINSYDQQIYRQLHSYIEQYCKESNISYLFS
jgi:hypothetical protein